jgi:hypothetical protein
VRANLVGVGQLSETVFVADPSFIERVTDFPYLGSRINATGDPSEEVRARIGQALTVFKSLSKTLWKRRQIPLTIKMRLFDSLVMSILLYCLDILPLKVADMRKLASFELHCLRCILGVNWSDMIRNVDILSRCGRTISLEARIRRRRLTWLGHVGRMADERLAKRCFFSEIPYGWKRKQGGQSHTWRMNVMKDTKDLTVLYERLWHCSWDHVVLELASDRAGWKECVRKC